MPFSVPVQNLEDVMVVDRQVFAARFNLFDEKMRHSGIEISTKVCR